MALPAGLISIPALSTVMRTRIGDQPCSIRITRYTIPKGIAAWSVPPGTGIRAGDHAYYFNNEDLGVARALMPASERSQSISKDFKRMAKEIVPRAAAAFV